MNINTLLTNVNFNDANRNANAIKYIVVHFVGATGGAEANCKYFQWTYRGASAHYFVGHQGEIWQCVLDEDIAWHCGAKVYYHPLCRNSNSIGIELCCRQNSNGTWYFEQATVNSAIELIKSLMAKYNIPVDNVIRHYDVTHKKCPEPYVRDASAWNAFKARLNGSAPSTPAPSTGSSLKVGDKVTTTKLATDSNGSKVYSGKWTGTITKILAGRAYPYLLNNGDLGWTNNAGIGVSSSPIPAPTPSSNTKYQVGQTVKITGVYNSSTSTKKLKPNRTLGTVTRIVKGARNPYLLDNGNLGWVNDSVIASGGSAHTSSSGTIVKGSRVVVTNPVDYNGTHLAVSGVYDVIQVNGNRIVIARNGSVIAAIHRNNLRLA